MKKVTRKDAQFLVQETFGSLAILFTRNPDKIWGYVNRRPQIKPKLIGFWAARISDYHRSFVRRVFHSIHHLGQHGSKTDVRRYSAAERKMANRYRSSI